MSKKVLSIILLVIFSVVLGGNLSDIFNNRVTNLTYLVTISCTIAIIAQSIDMLRKPKKPKDVSPNKSEED